MAHICFVILAVRHVAVSDSKIFVIANHTDFGGFGTKPSFKIEINQKVCARSAIRSISKAYGDGRRLESLMDHNNGLR
jgi:hypothetical protein